MLRNKVRKASLAVAWAPLLAFAHGCSSGDSSLSASDAAADGQGGSSGAAVQSDGAPSDSAPSGPDSADVGAGGSSGGGSSSGSSGSSSGGSPSGGGPDCGCDSGWQPPCPVIPTQG